MTSQPESLPPLAIRETIDKTIGFVIKNGPSFVERLKSNAAEKFSFLNESDPYHEYFQDRLQNIGSKSSEEEGQDELKQSNESPIEITAPNEFKFLVETTPISGLDLDILKLSALFVAKNGPSYQQHLITRQRKLQQEAQFEFLKPTHSLYPLYQEYVKQYQTVITMGDGVKSLILDPTKILEVSFGRAMYAKAHKKKVQDEKKLQQAAHIAYASIDWQDFSMVGRIQFDAIDEVRELAVPLNRKDLVYRSLEGRKQDVELEVAPVPEKENIENETTTTTTTTTTPTPTAAPPKGMKIKAAGESRLKKNRVTTSTNTTIESMITCPLTGEKIPELKFDSHIKILLRDPRYKEQQENYIRKNFTYGSNLSTDEVYENIKRMTNKRKGIDTLEPPKKTSKIVGPSPDN